MKLVYLTKVVREEFRSSKSMRLKWLELRAFKAYEELTHIDFDQHINCIVGLNGSGKSTILEAITVLVSEACGKRNVEAKALLHKGSRHQAVLGHVEICLENARPAAGELRLKKTFSLSGSGDAYFIDGKRSTKQNFVTGLTSAGFSRNNPYYIVGQGKVQDLAVISDQTRLKLLKDLSGIGIYEEKRNEALKRLEEHKINLKALDTSLIQERLENLRQQKSAIQRRNRLQQQEECYQLLAQQINLYGKILPAGQNNEFLVTGASNNFEEGSQQPSAPPSLPTITETRLRSELEALLKDRERIDSQLQQVNEFGALYQVKRGQIDSRETEWRETLNAAKNLDKELSGLRRKQLETKCRLSEIQKKDEQRAKNEHKLETTLIPERQSLIEAARRFDQRVIDLQADVERQRLSAGLNLTQYKSTKEKRQHVLNKIIPSIQQQIAELKQEGSSVLNELRAVSENAEKSPMYQRKLEEINSVIQCVRAELPAVTRKLAEMTAAERPFDHFAVEQEYSKVERLYKAAVRRGYNSVLGARNQSPGVFLRECHDHVTKWLTNENAGDDFDGDILGPVWSLIEPVSVELETAVNAALAMKLDALVVRDDEVASALCSILKNSFMPGSSLTVTPLKQIAAKFQNERRAVNARGVALTHTDQKLKAWSADIEAVPLIAALVPAHGPHSNKLDSLLRQIAGNFILVRDADIGNRLRSVSDCVCLDGTLITKKGTLTGGYRPTHNNVLAIARNIRIVCAEASESLTHVADKRLLISQKTMLQEKLNEGLLERQRLEGHLRSAGIFRATAERLQARLQSVDLKTAKLQASLKTYTDFVSQKSSVSSAEALEKFKVANENLTSAQRERKEIQAQIDDIEDAITAVRRLLSKAVDSQEASIEEELGQLELTLNREIAVSQALRKRRQNLEAGIESLQDELAQMELEFPSVINSSSTDIGSVLSEQLKGEHENVCAKISYIQNSLASQQKLSSELWNRLQEMLIDQSARDLYLKICSEIEGSSSSQAPPNPPFSPNSSTSSVKSRLDAAQKQLRKELDSMGPLNDRAVDDLESHEEEYRVLVRESQDIKESTEKLVELIDSLNKRRHSLLLECFKTVNDSLQHIFKAVVPQGYAEMAIISRIRDEISQPTSIDKTPPPSRVAESSMTDGGLLPSMSAIRAEESNEEVVGASLKASFTPANDALPMNSLSGGQKTIVALCLLIAMQRYEPAPFYILDEVDAALDDRYRSNVAALLKNSLQQYLCTSFRPEFVEVGSKHFKVENSARVAHIQTCSLAEAKALVQKESTP